MLKRIKSPGGIAGLLSAGALIAGVFGQSSLSSFLGNPATAQVLASTVDGLGIAGTVLAGFLPHKAA